MAKLLDPDKAWYERVVASCGAGLNSVLENKLVIETTQLFQSIFDQLAVLTETDPLFFIKDQVLRSSSSVMANLIEGMGRITLNDYRRHLSYSRGSLYETAGWLHVLKLTDLIDRCNVIAEQLNEIMLSVTHEIRTEETGILHGVDNDVVSNEFQDTAVASRRFGESLEEFQKRISTCGVTTSS